MRSSRDPRADARQDTGTHARSGGPRPNRARWRARLCDRGPGQGQAFEGPTYREFPRASHFEGAIRALASAQYTPLDNRPDSYSSITRQIRFSSGYRSNDHRVVNMHAAERPYRERMSSYGSTLTSSQFSNPARYAPRAARRSIASSARTECIRHASIRSRAARSAASGPSSIDRMIS